MQVDPHFGPNKLDKYYLPYIQLKKYEISPTDVLFPEICAYILQYT